MGTDFTDNMYRVNYTAGSGMGDQTCFNYSTIDDTVTEYQELFVLDLISSDIDQLEPDDSTDATVILIIDNDSKFSLVGTKRSHTGMLVG